MMYPPVGKKILFVMKTNPSFMKEWNEYRGWDDCWDYEGYELQIDDFLASLGLLKTCEMGIWIIEEEIKDMQDLVMETQKKDFLQNSEGLKAPRF